MVTPQGNDSQFLPEEWRELKGYYNEILQLLLSGHNMVARILKVTLLSQEIHSSRFNGGWYFVCAGGCFCAIFQHTNSGIPLGIFRTFSRHHAVF